MIPIFILIAIVLGFGLGYSAAEKRKWDAMRQITKKVEENLEARELHIRKLESVKGAPTPEDIKLLNDVTAAQSFDKGIVYCLEIFMGKEKLS